MMTMYFGNIMGFKKNYSLIKGRCLFFISNLPGAQHIPDSKLGISHFIKKQYYLQQNKPKIE